MIAAPQIFADDLSGQWCLDCDDDYWSYHEKKYYYRNYREPSIYEKDHVSTGSNLPDQPLVVGGFGWAVQSDGRIKGYVTPTDTGSDKPVREIALTGTIYDDNRVILTFTIPGMTYFFEHGGYSSSTEITGSFDGVYDPVGIFISGRFQYNQERIYLEHWDMFGEVTYTREATNVVVSGPFIIAIHNPVILIPGWAHDENVWRDFAQFFSLDFANKPWVTHLGLEWRFDNPFFEEVELLQYSDPDTNAQKYSDPNTNAKILYKEINRIRIDREWTNTKIDLIAHSQGGLDARAYLRDLGDKAKDQVRSLTMIATPNHGTIGAVLRNWYYRLTLRPKECTPWLTPREVERFNRGTPLVKDVKYYTVAGLLEYSPFSLKKDRLGSLVVGGQDDGVVPVKSVHLDGATVIGPLTGEGTFPYGHSELVTKQDVYDAIKYKVDPPYSEEPNSLAFIAMEDGGAFPAQPVSRSVIVDDVNDVVFLLISGTYPGFTLQSPSGEYITPQSLNVTFDYGEWLDLRVQAYIVREPAAGVWQAHAGTGTPHPFILIISAENTFVLDGSTDEYFNEVGDTVGLRATLDAAATITDMWADITDPNGLQERVTLYDDGLHEDDLPNDGVYANAFSPSLEGEHILIFSAEGVVGERIFSRADLESIFVVASGADSF